MKKSGNLWVSFFIGLVLLVGTCPGIKAGELKFGLRLSGGMAYFNLGDVNASIRGRVDYFKEESKKAGYPLSGDLQSLHFGLDAGVDLFLFLNPRLAFSLGSGYIAGSAGKGGQGLTIQETSETIHTTNELRVQAIPITLGVYYFFPLGSDLRLYAGAGASYYATKFKNSNKGDTEYGYWVDYQEDNGYGVGMSGSLGFEFNVAPAVAVFLEGSGQFAKIGNFEGKGEYTSTFDHETWTGKLYYYESYEWWTDRWYPTLDTLPEKPAESWMRNIREGIVDLSGFALRAGLRIQF